jgi:flavin reductase (DIM6/NTAB) family NADH-FMN oxidoreductase RutF
MFSAKKTPPNMQRDTVHNVEATGVFVWSLATYALRETVNATAEQVEYGVDKFKNAGLKK